MFSKKLLVKLGVSFLVVVLGLLIIPGCGGGSSHAPALQAIAPVQHVAPSGVVYPAATYCLGDLDNDGSASAHRIAKRARNYLPRVISNYFS